MMRIDGAGAYFESHFQIVRIEYHGCLPQSKHFEFAFAALLFFVNCLCNLFSMQNVNCEFPYAYYLIEDLKVDDEVLESDSGSEPDSSSDSSSSSSQSNNSQSKSDTSVGPLDPVVPVCPVGPPPLPPPADPPPDDSLPLEMPVPEPVRAPAIRGLSSRALAYYITDHGKVTFYPGSKVFEAKCKFPGHGDCRVTKRSTAPGRKAEKHQGRPAALLVAWLEEGNEQQTSALEHRAVLPSLAKRKAVRTRLKGAGQHAIALLDAERPPLDCEPDSEPSEFEPFDKDPV